MPPRPPRLAERFIRLTCPREDRDAVLGDLAEEHDVILRNVGRRAARGWYRRQMLASSLAHLRRRLFDRERRYTRDNERSSSMSSLLQDIRFGWRMLRRRPVVTVVALLSLVVGMSAATLVFSLLNAVAFRALPVVSPWELRLLFEQRQTGLNHNLSFRDFVEIAEGQRAFTMITAYSAVRATVTYPQGSQLVGGEIVSGSFFAMLGVPMHVGRGLTPDDDRPGSPPAVVVSERLWRRLKEAGAVPAPAGGREVLSGNTIVLNTEPFTIVGVVAEPFRGMQIGRDAQFWVPLHHQPGLQPADGPSLLERPGASWLTLLGRLRSGVADTEAVAELDRVERALPATPVRPRTRTFAVRPGRQGDSALPATVASPLQLLLAAAGLVLVVACANVAGLQLARAAERERELALRNALGASRGRLTRLLLTEAALLGAGATALAVAISTVAARAAVPLLSRFGEPVVLDVAPDWRVLAFSVATGVTTTIGFGLVPILATLRRPLTAALAETSRGSSSGRGRTRLRRALVAAQFALSLALVFVALLLVRTLHNLRTMPTGFSIDRLAVLAVDPAAARLPPSRTAEYYTEAAARLRTVPGVEAAGFAMIEPLDFGGSRTTVDIPGYTPRPDEDMELNYNRVSAEYFDAMGIAPIDGRVFDGRDIAGAPRAMVVNETMARRFWGGSSAVGREVRLSPTSAAAVVGVVPDVKYRTLRESPGPSFYVSAAQSRPPFVSFHVRTTAPPAPLLDRLRRALAEVDPAVPITRVRTLREQAAINVSDDALAMTIATGLSGAALLLAAVGLYGAMAYVVGQRSREIGIRLALGAVRSDVHRFVLRQGVMLALAGSLAGVGLGVIFARAIRHRLLGVAPADVTTIAAAVLVIGAVALVATWTPARRASRVDPVEALRVE